MKNRETNKYRGGNLGGGGAGTTNSWERKHILSHRNVFLFEVGVEVQAVANGVYYGTEHVKHVSLLVDGWSGCDRSPKNRERAKREQGSGRVFEIYRE